MRNKSEQSGPMSRPRNKKKTTAERRALHEKEKVRKLTNAVLVLVFLAGLSLLLYPTVSDYWNSLHASRAVSEYAEQVNAQEATTTETTLPETEPTVSVPEMPTQTVNGWDYIGYLSIPSLDLTLPIQSQWSYEGLRVAPGRFYGSTYTGDLVLTAHNYSQHFGRIGDLQPGDTVCFTDMDGHVTNYRVTALETLAPEDVEGMLSGEYDLTLFTCTVGGKSRVTVRCTEA